ncbi:MAG: ATP-dependent DNA helicase [Candidatus Nanoarchaeia archaeon]|nr:ATP-dependent DNA helicase [Candidatus Nanoarchaeia archaeon]
MDLLFPHEEIRDIQNTFMNDLFSALKENKHILIHAPTGIGKTAAALSPALKYALETKKTLYFLTSRHTQHKIAIETLRKIQEKHKLDFKIADFIGKKWMCLVPGVDQLTSSEFAEYCKEAIKKDHCEYYSRLKAKNDLSSESKRVIKEIGNITEVEKVCELCKNHGVCPYEVTLLLAKEANVIIADYFHILNSHIRKNFFSKTEKSLENSIIIFDEAHNLPERIRNLMSSNISSFIVSQAVREAKDLGYKEISEDIEKIKHILEKLAQEVPINLFESKVSKDYLNEKIKEVLDLEEFIGNLVFVGEQVLELKRRSFCITVATFLESWQGPDLGFTRILTKGFDKKDLPIITLYYHCLDPSVLFKEISTGSLIIGMSGTLSPLDMYKDILGIDAVLKEYEDPFPQQNRLNLVVPKTTTKFSERRSEMYQKIAALGSAIINTIPGNSIVFFPSYELRDNVFPFFKDFSEKTIFLESSGLTKTEKEDLINKFKSYSGTGAVMLAVSSGSLGEGIDLPGDYLKGVVVIGLPLSKPDLKTNELIEYYQKRFSKGWEYGYVYPAMLKTVQNAGRCIRSETDKGIIVFMDERYIQSKYRACFPKNWHIKITNSPVVEVREFFEKNNI